MKIIKIYIYIFLLNVQNSLFDKKNSNLIEFPFPNLFIRKWEFNGWNLLTCYWNWYFHFTLLILIFSTKNGPTSHNMCMHRCTYCPTDNEATAVRCGGCLISHYLPMGESMNADGGNHAVTKWGEHQSADILHGRKVSAEERSSITSYDLTKSVHVIVNGLFDLNKYVLKTKHVNITTILSITITTNDFYDFMWKYTVCVLVSFVCFGGYYL